LLGRGEVGGGLPHALTRFVQLVPGATNASIGVHTAFQDSTPMILFVGDVPDGVECEHSNPVQAAVGSGGLGDPWR
jgi:hypothetical protein